MHSLLHGKPAARILLPFVAGIACANRLDIPWSWPAAVLSLLLVLAFLVYLFRRTAAFAVLVLCAFFCAGWLRLALARQAVPPNDVRSMADWPAPLSLEGVISSPVEVRGDRQIFRFAVDSLWTEERGFSAAGQTRVTVYDTLGSLRQGDRLVVKGMLRRPSGSHNPGDFDYRAWLAGQGIHTQFSVTDATRLLRLARDQDPPLQRYIIRPVRDHALRVIRSGLESEPRALLGALLIGVRTEIDDKMREEFSQVGVVHVLAVSGLHVGFVLAALLLLINVLRIPFRARLPLLLAGIYLYVLITASAPPVVRAAVMAGLLLAAPLLQRRLNPVNAIALAALIILVLNPLDLFGAGFQLSFAATLGIILIYRRFDGWAASHIARWREEGRFWAKSALQLLMVSFAAQIATLPLTAFYFNYVPLYGLLANLAVVPLVSLIVMVGFVAIVFALAWPVLGFVFLQCDWLLLQLLIMIVKKSAALPGAALEVATPSFFLLAMFYLAVALALSWPQPRLAKRWVLAALLTANGWVWSQAIQPQRNMRVIFFDVGQGDAALIAFPNGVNYLIDSGEANERTDCGKNVILPWLRRNGIRAIDAALITHSHSDHAGGLRTLLARRRIKALYHPGDGASRAFRSLDSLAAACGVPVHAAGAGFELMPCPGAWLRILHPSAGSGEPWDENDGSMVVRLQFGRRVFLFLADIESGGEARLLPYSDFLRSDVVKVAHHGSATASTPELIRSVDARFAVVSAGLGNRFGLPAPSVVANWTAAGSRVLRTDESGAVLFRCDGDTLICEQP